MFDVSSSLRVTIASESKTEESVTRGVLNELCEQGVIGNYAIHSLPFAIKHLPLFGGEAIMGEAVKQARLAFDATKPDYALCFKSGSIRYVNETFYQTCVAVINAKGETRSNFAAPIRIPEWLLRELEQDRVARRLKQVLERIEEHNPEVTVDAEYIKRLLHLPTLFTLREHTTAMPYIIPRAATPA